MAQRGDIYPELLEVIGEDALFAFVEAFAGRRLHVPVKVRPNNQITLAIGEEAAKALSARFAPDVIRVPIARELRALRLKAQRLSNGRIATRLGITESAVEKMLRRVRTTEV